MIYLKKYSFQNGYCKECAKQKDGKDNLFAYTGKNFKKEEKNGSGSVQYWNGFEVYNFDSKSLDYDPECYREALKEYGKTY